jgi:Fic family protein
MTSTVTQTLERLAQTLNDLPEDAQADVLAELESRVESLTKSQLTKPQRDLVKRRLAEPREYADAEDVEALLRRFNPGL